MAEIESSAMNRQEMRLMREMRLFAASFFIMVLSSFTQRAVAVDEDKAMDTLEVNKCLKCHSVDKKKEGPSYKEVAKKYKGKPDAEAKIYKHLTTAPMVEIDGVEEEHKVIKVKNKAETTNLIQWILSR